MPWDRGVQVASRLTLDASNVNIWSFEASHVKATPLRMNSPRQFSKRDRPELTPRRRPNFRRDWQIVRDSGSVPVPDPHLDLPELGLAAVDLRFETMPLQRFPSRVRRRRSLNRSLKVSTRKLRNLCAFWWFSSYGVRVSCRGIEGSRWPPV